MHVKKNNAMMVLQPVLLVMVMLGLTAPTQTNALIQFNPISSSLWDHHMIDDPFRILEQTPFTVPNPTVQEALALARADWKETATAHVISLDVPGMKKEGVKIEVEENRVLRISGERKADDQEGDQGDNYKWHRAERTNGKFWRQFRLPGNADLDQIKAHLEDGVLRIMVPKFAAEKKRQPKLISIASSSSTSADHGVDVNPTKGVTHPMNLHSQQHKGIRMHMLILIIILEHKMNVMGDVSLRTLVLAALRGHFQYKKVSLKAIEREKLLKGGDVSMSKKLYSNGGEVILEVRSKEINAVKGSPSKGSE
ncbi:hypothetical protein ACFX2A_045662 [Malus domestica]